MKKKIRISLIQNNAFLSKENMPPLGLIYLSAYLKKKGITDVHILDLMLSKTPKKVLADYLKKLDHSSHNLIGFYMNTPTRFVVKDAIKMTREIVPNAVICAGGPHPTLDRESTLSNCGGLDFLVAGEGEETFYECVKTLSDDFNLRSLEKISGVSLKRGSAIVHNPLRPRIKDLDIIPFPDRDAVDIKSYRFSFPVLDEGLQKKLIPTSFISSRGCPYDCIFCSVADQWGRMATYHSTERVYDEIKYLIEKYKFNAIYFFDDTFTLNRNRVLEICEKILERNLNFHWFCEIRANTVDRELLSFMYKAGLRSVAMGVESASPRILKDIIKKGISIEEATEAIEVCKELGIFIKTFLSFSYPEETLDDVKMSLDYAKEIKPDAMSMTKLILYPGTPLFKHARSVDQLPKDFSWFKYYPFYGSARNEMVMPNYVDRLSLSDLLTIEKEILEISKLSRKKKRKLSYMLRVLLKNIKQVKSTKDLIIVSKRIINYVMNLLKNPSCKHKNQQNKE